MRTKSIGVKRLFWEDNEVDVLCRGWIQGIDNASIATKLPLRSNSDAKDKKVILLIKYGTKSAVFVEVLGSDCMDVDEEEESAEESAGPHVARRERSAKKKSDFSYFKRRRRGEAGDDDRGRQ